MKNLEALAQQVWAAPTPSEKVEIIEQMVATFQYKAKADKILAQARSLKSNTRLDTLAANLMLRDKDAVI